MKDRLNVLQFSSGNFHPDQANLILSLYPQWKQKQKALEIMGNRLSEMSCQKARDLLISFSPYNRVAALQVIKRYLSDSQSKLGEEYISSMFPFESQKKSVQTILNSVSSKVRNIFPAGGHKFDYAFGTTLALCGPNAIHTYGSLEKQLSMPSYNNNRRQIKYYFPPTYVDHKYNMSNADGFDFEGNNSYPGVNKHSNSRCITLRMKDKYNPLGCSRIGNYPCCLPRYYQS